MAETTGMLHYLYQILMTSSDGWMQRKCHTGAVNQAAALCSAGIRMAMHWN
jgi:hypothetical protein